MMDERRAAKEIAASGWFDEDWYREVYGGDEALSLDPITHYLRYGADCGRDPSPWFSTSAYRDQIGATVLADINPLWHYMQFGRAQGRQISPSVLLVKSRKVAARHAVALSAKALENKLWGGFSEAALSALQDKVRIPAVGDAERASACWVLARWFSAQGSPARAVQYLDQRAFIANDTSTSRDQHILLVNSLALAGNGERAWGLSSEARRRFKGAMDAQLISANALCALDDVQYESERLSAINRVFQSIGACTVEKADTSKPLTLSNLRCESAPETEESGDLITIIMPVFNAGESVAFAIESVLAQSWSHFELLVVDDCSVDDTVAVVSRFCERDQRVRLIRNPRNAGAYYCRNLALSEAKGTLITVHDSDDWSHAEKLERQVTALRGAPSALASLTDWVRVREDLFFTGTYRFGGTLVSENLSSLMFRRSIVDELGGWDVVRAGADTEFLRRIKARNGESSVVKADAGTPLSFSLDQPKSLTRTSLTHTRTQFYGPRREYRESAAVWHRMATPDELYFTPGANKRPFPAPDVMCVTPGYPRRYDLVVIADFNMSGGAYGSTMQYVEAALALGLRVALCQWRRFDLDTTVPFNEGLRRRALCGEFDVLSPGDEVTAETVLIGYPVILNYKPDLLPTLKTARLLILVNQMASRLYSGGDAQYDPAKITADVRRWFGVFPTWVPISGLVHRLMIQDGRYPTIHDDIWTPLQPVNLVSSESLHWRGSVRTAPIIGRHSRDHYTKWPQSAQQIRQAYCADQACEVRLLGGADCALSILEEMPRNWVVRSFTDDTGSFLKDLDFYVHYPFEDYIEEFGRAVLEAMSYGIPVILPPVFRDTFGSAATYAEPDEVWQCVTELWRNEQAYLEAGRKSYEFVRQNAGYDQLANRLNREMTRMTTPEQTEFELRRKVESIKERLEQAECELSQKRRELTGLTRLLESRERAPAHSFPTRPWYERFWRAASKRLPGRAVRAIAESPWFDPQWYQDHYPEVQRSALFKLSPALHYLRVGGFEGKDPGPDFDSDWYMNTNPDVKAAGVNPLYHYILFGQSDGRRPHPGKSEH